MESTVRFETMLVCYQHYVPADMILYIFQYMYWYEMDNHSIRESSYSWCTDKDSAGLMYGNISHWNTDMVNNMLLFCEADDSNVNIDMWDMSIVENIQFKLHTTIWDYLVYCHVMSLIFWLDMYTRGVD